MKSASIKSTKIHFRIHPSCEEMNLVGMNQKPDLCVFVIIIAAFFFFFFKQPTLKMPTNNLDSSGLIHYFEEKKNCIRNKRYCTYFCFSPINSGYL